MRVLRSLPRHILLAAILGLVNISSIQAFNNRHHRPPVSQLGSRWAPSTSLSAMKKGGKFNKHKDLAAKMEEARRQREQVEHGTPSTPAASAAVEEPSNEEIKLRNDRRRFEHLLENSMSRIDDGMEGGYYLTVEQEEENANAVFRAVPRLYEGDPAPHSPFAELVDCQTGETLGISGAARLLPWETNTKPNDDYILVLSDPRPKSAELRGAMKKICLGGVPDDIVRRCVFINTDTPGENKRFLKKNFPEGSAAETWTVLCDESLEWMREYTALGEERFSMTMFVLSEGTCQKIAREVDSELICTAMKNAISSMNKSKY